jgi:hypothetical protein
VLVVAAVLIVVILIVMVYGSNVSMCSSTYACMHPNKHTYIFDLQDNDEDEEMFVPSLFGSSVPSTPQSQQPPSHSSNTNPIARFSSNFSGINNNSSHGPTSYDYKKSYKRTNS